MKSTSTLDRAAQTLIQEVLRIKENENVLLISDFSNKWNLIHEIVSKILTNGAIPYVFSFNVTLENEDIPREAFPLLELANAIILISNTSLSFSRPLEDLLNKGKRIASCPRIDEDMFSRALSIDPKTLANETQRIASILSNASSLELISKYGKILTTSITGRAAVYVDGLANTPGKFTIIPGGIIGIAPIEGTTNGEVIVNGSISHLGIINSEIHLKIENGEIIDISGGDDAKKLEKLLDSYDNSDMYKIAEIGVGVHPLMKIRGNATEDESARGVIIIGLGDNAGHLGGKTKAPAHVDLSIKNASLKVDSKFVLVENGKLVGL
ncbi:hypothetical protein K1720_10270 [Thermococcus argininiproducens]|uniref:Leucyl aminopeptidase n=1 Tax=Thermococcus argininiproducens TaxID=2866384 RepID=A0A9E7MAD5_9EURY|nr:hypothetical protein [Thermococcus argininiproducens]USG99852.1 hypothetical protein K1720_10270 [Thermococcus argininiproducens]